MRLESSKICITIHDLSFCLSIPGGLFSCPTTFVYIFVYRNVEYVQVNRISKQRRQVSQLLGRIEPFHRFPIASKVVATAKQTKPDVSNSFDEAGALFHSPVTTPDSAAVMIMKIWNSPQPIEVPSEPR
jgi:hypothetical protein